MLAERSFAFSRRAFTLVEVIISLVILGIGVVFLLRLFPVGVQRSAESERLTRATLLAQEIMEAIKAEGGSGLIQIIPGSPEVVPMPGDGVDGDEDGMLGGVVNPWVDLNGNGVLDDDYDGYPEQDYEGWVGCPDTTDNVDSDFDGVIDDDGDSYRYECHPAPLPARPDYGILSPRRPPRFPDGDLNYDPELFELGRDEHGRPVFVGVDDEWPDGLDNDGNGIYLDVDSSPHITIDEDVCLATNFRNLQYWPLEPGDNLDNDGDGELVDPADPLSAYADGLDNDGDGKIDEGIDEEIYDWLDNDGDGATDEDCRAASYPFTPRKFFRRLIIDDDGDGITDEDPRDFRDNDLDGSVDEDGFNDDSDQFAWQIIVGRVPDGGGDGINNDGDLDTSMRPVVDEELRNGLNDDPTRDELVDEDCAAAPVRGFRRITVRITWNGNGDANRDGFPGDAGVDDDRDGGVDFLDPEIQAAMRMEALFLGIEGDPTTNPLLRERWAQDDDEDGRIDEEKPNGLDDDFDGVIDEEDYFTNEYNLTGFLEL